MQNLFNAPDDHASCFLSFDLMTFKSFQWLHRTHRKPLFEAVEKMKEGTSIYA